MKFSLVNSNTLNDQKIVYFDAKLKQNHIQFFTELNISFEIKTNSFACFLLLPAPVSERSGKIGVNGN